MKKRNYTLDVIKALAIMAVILIHGLTDDALYTILAPYYIWQTMPVFMIIMGMNATRSYEKLQAEKVSDILTKDFISKKIRRILLPFSLIWIIQVTVQFIYYNETSLLELFQSFFRGGYGPGSYFIPLIAQATILTPFIFVFLKKSPTRRMAILFIISMIVDFIVQYLGISGTMYRLLIVRHIFSLTLGVWFVLKKKPIRLKVILPLASLSLVYITAVHYFDWELLVELYWHSQHAPSYFYVLLLIVLGLRYLNVKKESPMEKGLILTGQASYHIFLTQMLYFWLINDQLKGLPDFFYVSALLIIPLISGIGFYLTDKKCATYEFRNKQKVKTKKV